MLSQSAFTCSKLTTETLEQGVKHVQNCSSVSVVNFEHVIASWDVMSYKMLSEERLPEQGKKTIYWYKIFLLKL